MKKVKNIKYLKSKKNMFFSSKNLNIKNIKYIKYIKNIKHIKNLKNIKNLKYLKNLIGCPTTIIKNKL